jgi:hypothetical protein
MRALSLATPLQGRAGAASLAAFYLTHESARSAALVGRRMPLRLGDVFFEILEAVSDRRTEFNKTWAVARHAPLGQGGSADIEKRRSVGGF